jgi:hypothetical protein
MRRCCTAFGWIAFVAFFLVANGCGKGKGNISGKVDLEGKTVQLGDVTFYASNGVPFSAKIGRDGTYTIKDVPAGAAKIVVQSPNPKDVPKNREGAATADDAKIWFPLPDPYEDPKSSDLTFEVKPGDNTYNISLKKIASRKTEKGRDR